MFESNLNQFTYTEVPVHFLPPKDGFPIAYIDVFVNGVKLKVPVDTGNRWGGVLLSPKTLSGLDVRFTGQTLVNYDAFGNKYRA
jgi:hypothetical protein